MILVELESVIGGRMLPTNNWIVFLKLATLATLIGIVYYLKDTTLLIGESVDQGSCISDRGLRYFEKANNLLNDPSREKLRDTVLITAAFIQDLSFVFLAVIW